MSRNMGLKISTHRGTLGAGGWWWYVGILGVVSALSSGAQAVKLFMADQGERALGALWAVALAGLWGLCLVVPLWRWRQSVEVFEEGILWTRLLGTVAIDRGEVIDVRIVRHFSRMGQHSEVALTLCGGRERSFIGIQNAEQVANFAHAWAAENRSRTDTERR